MAKAVALKKEKASVTTIDQTFSAFLKELQANIPASAMQNAEMVINMLRDDIDSNADDETGGQFCKQAAPDALVMHLDRFLRYCAMRENVLTFEQLQFVFFVASDLCEWLHTKEYFSDKAYKEFLQLKERHASMWERALKLVHRIDKSIISSKVTGKSIQTIEFGRHDVAEIKDDQIWMEIWSPMVLPKETRVGPITLPKGVAASLEVGWMITCELAKTKSGWHIVEVGNIYPSLPFA